jgi:hypothetical protein
MVTRVSAALAALVWFLGAPLVASSGVIPSGGEYVWLGLLGVFLGFTLVPVVEVQGHPTSARLTDVIRISGLLICGVLGSSGILLLLAALRLGAHAQGWISNVTLLGFFALFIWIGLASYVQRGQSSRDRAMFWIGMVTALGFTVPTLGAFFLTYVAEGFTFTNLTVLPFGLADLVVWVSLPAWLVAVIVRTSPETAPQGTATDRPS